MLDVILADFRGKLGEMRAEVSRRRAVTAVDPVADTTEYWAGDLERMLNDMSRRYATVTPKEYAQIHGGVPSSVRRWCERGELAGAQQDATGQWRIPRGAIRRRVVRRYAAASSTERAR
jgi:hypothetical protein